MKADKCEISSSRYNIKKAEFHTVENNYYLKKTKKKNTLSKVQANLRAVMTNSYA